MSSTQRFFLGDRLFLLRCYEMEMRHAISAPSSYSRITGPPSSFLSKLLTQTNHDRLNYIVVQGCFRSFLPPEVSILA